MPSYAQQLNNIQAATCDYLKQQGFKRRGRTLNRETEPGLIQVINFQLGQRWLAGRFTINLGVFIREVYEATYKQPLKDFASESSCEIRSRIGLLMPEGRDHWWSLVDKPDSDSGMGQKTSNHRLPILQPPSDALPQSELSQEVLDCVQQYGLSFLDQFTTRAGIIVAWEQNKLEYQMPPRAPLSIGIMLANQGQLDRARQTIQTYFNTVDKRGHQQFILEITSKLGIEIEFEER